MARTSIEVIYDPARPGDARVGVSLLGALAMLLILAVPVLVAAVGLYFVGHAVAALWGGW